jgi:hypothetical protein
MGLWHWLAATLDPAAAQGLAHPPGINGDTVRNPRDYPLNLDCDAVQS